MAVEEKVEEKEIDNSDWLGAGISDGPEEVPKVAVPAEEVAVEDKDEVAEPIVEKEPTAEENLIHTLQMELKDSRKDNAGVLDRMTTLIEQNTKLFETLSEQKAAVSETSEEKAERLEKDRELMESDPRAFITNAVKEAAKASVTTEDPETKAVAEDEALAKKMGFNSAEDMKIQVLAGKHSQTLQTAMEGDKPAYPLMDATGFINLMGTKEVMEPIITKMTRTGRKVMEVLDDPDLYERAYASAAVLYEKQSATAKSKAAKAATLDEAGALIPDSGASPNMPAQDPNDAWAGVEKAAKAAKGIFG